MDQGGIAHPTHQVHMELGGKWFWECRAHHQPGSQGWERQLGCICAGGVTFLRTLNARQKLLVFF